MNDEEKSKEQLIEELIAIRQKRADSGSQENSDDWSKQNEIHFKELIKIKESLEVLVDERTRNLKEVNKKLNQIIRKQKKSQKKIRKSEEKYRSLFVNLQSGFALHEMVFDQEGIPEDYIFLDLNKAFEQQTRLRREDLIGRRVSEVLPGIRNDGVNWINLYGNVVLTGESISFESYSKVLEKWYSVVAYRPRKGQFAAIFSDITERKVAEENSQIFAHAIDKSIDGIVITDLDGKIRFINNAQLSMFGYTASETIGKSVNIFHDFEHSNYPNEVIIPSVKANGFWTGEISQKRKDGSTFIAMLTTSVITDSQGTPLGLQGVIRDITEQKKLESQLRQSQKLEALGILTGGIAHEFNNLLSPILGYTELLIGNKTEHDSERESLDQIQISGIRAKKLVEQMLSFGRQSLLQKVSLNLEPLVEETIRLLKNTIPSNILIKKEIENNLPSILAVPDEISQVLLNLCLNGNHAMPNGGELTICLKKENSSNLNLPKKQIQGEEYIGLSVRDTGDGMNQSTLDCIFDPFFTTKPVGQGSGLGLSVVQGIVEQHKGYIEVNSKVGKGTTFHLYFPVTDEEVKPLIAEASNEPLATGTEHILLIDDEPIINKLTKRILEKLGYTVRDFLDSTEALKQFSEFPQEFDLVITDFGMPSINGKELAKRLKQVRDDIPVLVITGYGDLKLKEELHQWEIDDLLIKPFELKQLSTIVRKVLDKKSIKTE
ncbi:MAG: PAS domain S-box protein [SAR324 cluster bacterium]|nr:PAS domain S-box protein [SAR324 cluster bacterium]